MTSTAECDHGLGGLESDAHRPFRWFLAGNAQPRSINTPLTQVCVQRALKSDQILLKKPRVKDLYPIISPMRAISSPLLFADNSRSKEIL